MSKLRDDAIAQIQVLTEALDAERALADDLALVVHVSVKYGRPPEQAAEVLARYREARGV